MRSHRTYRVSELAQCTGISVRTLHYYEEIRLLVPKQRSGAGYRLYDDDDLVRLQQILMGRDQGLALEEIRRTLDDPHFDRRSALLARRQQLQKQARDTARMIHSLDAALALLDGHAGEEMDMTQLFTGFDPSKYEEEARARWGDTEHYREAAKRTQRYTSDDWQQIKREQSAIYAQAFALLQGGCAADSKDAMDLAELHRRSVDRWFYPCSHSMHASLADLYEADSRFSENMDKFGHGVSAFLAAAIRANARRDGGD